ncbi:MAG: hypothetical protein HRU27_06625 [Rhizobiaceae bacterium]|nr:hypothetical protein [Rhizobiaceae bacterium]
MANSMNVHRQVKSELRFLLWSAVALGAGYLAFVYPHTNDFSISPSECQKLDTYWRVKLQRDFQLGSGWKNSDTLACPSNEASLARAIRFIDEAQLVMSGRPATPSYYQWAKELKPRLSQNILFGLAGRTRFEERIIELSPILLDKANWVQIAGVIVHELRHLEQGVNTHVPCKAEPGLACDRELDLNPETGDAYSYNILFLRDVRGSSTTSSYEKKLATREMQSIFNKRFNAVAPDLFKTLQLQPRT